jgi:hypothetical protein
VAVVEIQHDAVGRLAAPARFRKNSDGAQHQNVSTFSG